MSAEAEEREKREVAYHAVDTYVRPGMCIGLGTGSTAYWAIERVGELVRGGLELRAVPTSLETERLCRERSIELAELDAEPLDVAIDGADEATADFSLIKGGGGALFREKAVAIAAKSFVVVVTARKLVRTLGAFPVPVEVVPFSAQYVAAAIERFCPLVRPRLREGRPYVTDNGNLILDCTFGTIADPPTLDRHLRAIHGIVATGLFIDLATHVLIATSGGVETFARTRPAAS
jgi:ribose 5-phosphate isomerase A